MLNKKSQHYDVLGRFRVNTGQGEVEFCRVKFMATKHEDVIPATKVKTGDFEDISIVVRPTPVKPIVVKSVTEEEKAKLVKAFEESIAKEPVGITVATAPSEFEVDESTILVLPAGFEIIATNPKGKEITVNSLDLDTFCAKNNLDVEGVQSVIDGAQKTHKKWRFAKA
ncbi:hypothetical protein CN984_12125 [Bacillus cereus]|uniref:Uncharacterized protein n=1 Tax=Bacillus cereus TaxID=1396 RepID=A0A2B9Q2J4_BACCE|nr:hypothetical protein [Bacillus cereus]PGO29186.1 hypothetical protein CN984_12125 [Bacillus cereus]